MTDNTITLLCVDDDTAFTKVADHLLAKYKNVSFRVIWKSDGKSALEELEANPSIELVLLDYNLPDHNGLEITRAIREKGNEIPIVFLSAEKDFRLAIEAIKYRVEDYLVKGEVMNASFPETVFQIYNRAKSKKLTADQFRRDLIARRKADAVKELIVTVCHEFNNPLAAMKISTDILKKHNLSTEEKTMVASLDANIRVIEKEITKLRDLNLDRIDFQNS